MKQILVVVCLIVCLHDIYGGTYTFSTDGGQITELATPWTRLGDTLRVKLYVKNLDTTPQSVKLSVSTRSGVIEKNDGPLYFLVGGALFDSLRFDLAAGESREVMLIDIPERYAPGRFKRYVNLYEGYSSTASTILPIDVHSALAFRTGDSSDGFVARLLELPVGASECLPVYFHNRTGDAHVLTDFLSVNLPNWIKVENKFTLPVVTLPGELLYFSDICLTPPEPNLERLEGPVYLIHKQGSESKTRNVQLYITSKLDTNLLRTCVEIVPDSALFGPVELGMEDEQQLRIKSNRNYPIQLTSASFTWGDVEGFSFDATFPIAVEPFGEVSIPVTFSPTTTEPAIKRRYAVGFTVHAVSDSATCDPSITLTGLYGELAVEEQLSTAALTISSNPVLEQATISVTGLSRAVIEVWDMLGNVVAFHEGSEFEILGGASQVLIARARGTDSSGKLRILSRMLVVAR